MTFEESSDWFSMGFASAYSPFPYLIAGGGGDRRNTLSATFVRRIAHRKPKPRSIANRSIQSRARRCDAESFGSEING
jgi:hypothetical protein